MNSKSLSPSLASNALGGKDDLTECVDKFYNFINFIHPS